MIMAFTDLGYNYKVEKKAAGTLVPPVRTVWNMGGRRGRFGETLYSNETNT